MPNHISPYEYWINVLCVCRQTCAFVNKKHLLWCYFLVCIFNILKNNILSSLYPWLLIHLHRFAILKIQYVSRLLDSSDDLIYLIYILIALYTFYRKIDITFIWCINITLFICQNHSDRDKANLLFPNRL